MVYSTYNAGEQHYLVSGSGIFVAPNLILTVAHNFLEANKETGEGHIRGGKSAQFYYNVGSNSEKEKLTAIFWNYGFIQRKGHPFLE